jgi:hypothetical protein
MMGRLVSPALRNSVVVDAEHQLLRILPIQIKNSFQHMHYELHRSVLVIQKEHFIDRGVRHESFSGSHLVVTQLGASPLFLLLMAHIGPHADQREYLLWHLTDMVTPLADARFRGKSEHQI